MLRLHSEPKRRRIKIVALGWLAILPLMVAAFFAFQLTSQASGVWFEHCYARVDGYAVGLSGTADTRGPIGRPFWSLANVHLDWRELSTSPSAWAYVLEAPVEFDSTLQTITVYQNGQPIPSATDLPCTFYADATANGSGPFVRYTFDEADRIPPPSFVYRSLAKNGTWHWSAMANYVGRLTLKLLAMMVFGLVLAYALCVIDENKLIQRGCCIHCFYDISSTPDRCPECGRHPSRAGAVSTP